LRSCCAIAASRCRSPSCLWSAALRSAGCGARRGIAAARRLEKKKKQEKEIQRTKLRINCSSLTTRGQADGDSLDNRDWGGERVHDLHSEARDRGIAELRQRIPCNTKHRKKIKKLRANEKKKGKKKERTEPTKKGRKHRRK
jgi:hypothetical protein